jgi:hypothetical protein
MNLIAGLDLGQVGDFTALAVLEKTEGDARGKALYDCHHLQRFDLGSEYTEICSRVAALVSGPPYAGNYITLAVDASGVGRPVVEMLRRHNMPVTLKPIVITGGHQWSKNEDGYYHVPKLDLVGCMKVVGPASRLRIASDVPARDLLMRELRTFQIKISKAANEIYEAREGANDDLVLAVAMAVWVGENVFTGAWQPKTHPGQASEISKMPKGVFASDDPHWPQMGY